MAPTPQSTATKTKSIQSIFLRTKASDDLRSENNQEETHIELAQTEGFKQPPRTAPMRQATGSRRDIFQRAASQPLPEAPSTLTLSQTTAKLPPLNVQSTEVNTTAKNGRSSMFESCIQVLATVITASFHTINTHQTYKDTSTTAPDSTTIRTAKLLYVSMLEKVQKERGEWQGFNSDEKGPEQHEIVEETVADVLNASLRELKNAVDEFLVLNELMDVSFRNLRGALISPQLYIKHKPQLMQALMPMQEDGSMAPGTTHFPPSFSSLLTVRAFLNEINRDEVLCLLRLLCLWAAIGTVSQRDQKEDMLKRVIEDKHSRVFSEIPETAFIAGRKDDRQDPLAIDLLLLLLHYRDILFGDIEYLMIRQEMKVTKSVDSEEPSSAITCAPNQSTKSILSNKAYEGVLLPPRQEMNVTPKPVNLREPSSPTTNTPDGCTKSILGNKLYEGVTRKGTQQPVKLILKSPKKQKSRMAKHHLMDENHTQRLVESAEKTNSVRHRQKATVNTTKTPKKQALTTVLCKALPKPTNSTFIENYWKISAATVTLCAVLGITCLAFRKIHS